ncbi:protease inhibitor I42 family protein [Brevibacillus choshinensis]|uniref:Protease inhibitor I42 family protein n=1 Tax=Brevibacillus choshinensis TaxID=54911 RepID=A0ABX7FIS5_BRECH|nr:protease inhibitor I42 family protein [Brevibacillus choshinensis]QRG65519.1 protease inhibitor I42 family protein [Brevibacillus choshinensis]
MADSTTHSIRAAAGHSFALTFPANPTTGYQWFFSNPLDQRFLTLVSNEYIPPASPSRIGQSGHQVLTFHAHLPGMTSIAMKYCRPWDDTDCGTFSFTIVQIS